ncbi:MAG: LysR family transcriptional regulator, partial [Oscillospiraceae bacterium]
MLLKELRYVLAIHTYGTMAKASQHLYISQPALSKYIQNLEDTLNVELFHRNNG